MRLDKTFCSGHVRYIDLVLSSYLLQLLLLATELCLLVLAPLLGATQLKARLGVLL